MKDMPLSAYVEAMEHGRPWLDPDRFDAWLMHRCFGHWSFLAMDRARPVGAVLAIPERSPRQAAIYLDQIAKVVERILPTENSAHINAQ